MTYNLHPIFVHFPIALLFLYSIIKILPLKKWFPNVNWLHIERVLLSVGVLGAFAALTTGETAERLVRPNRQLVEAHSTFAATATWLYGFLLAGELAMIFNTVKFSFIKMGKWMWLSLVLGFVERVFCNPVFSKIVALLALVTISLTGLLGGVIAYGVTADPFAGIFLSWLGISL